MINVGVLGAGHLGKIHLKLLSQRPEFTLLGFFDPDPTTAAIVAQDSGLKSWPSAEELAREAQALVIVSPTLTHADYALDLVRQGKHVFIEKPVTGDVDSAKKLVSLVKEARVVAQVGHVERYNPAFLAVQASNLGLNPMFIEAHRLAPWNPRGADVSVVMDLMIHDIDLVLKLVNSGLKRVSASGVAVITDTPDICNARLEFHNGAVANLTASRISVKAMRRMRLFQPSAYLTMDFLEHSVEVFHLHDRPPAEGGLEMDMQGRKRWLVAQQLPVPQNVNAIDEELKAFAHSIATGAEPPVTVHDGYLAMDAAQQVLDRMQES